MELHCAIQTYEWGKKGSQSKVAQLASAANPTVEIKEDTPYAELWMGTHPNAPSIIASTGEPLLTWLQTHVTELGPAIESEFGTKDLPYLFKVLSVAKALSIQAHPNKKHAEELHKLRPDLYKDPNHKPEIAIALTQFEALCGFRPLHEIKRFLQDVPELHAVIGHEKISALLMSDEATTRYAIQDCFTALMTCPNDVLCTQLNTLVERVSAMEESSRPVCLGDLLLQINAQFPNDVGCFGIYFFNYVVLEPGEALFLGPNEPHAYLSGDCIECMACSDNVVRAGLTPKFKDVKTLCEMLSYECGTAADKKFSGLSENSHTILFRPPVRDFAVAKIQAIPPGVEYSFIPRNNASIVIIVEGNGTANGIVIRPGTIMFLPAGETLVVKVTDRLLAFQACCLL